MACSRTEESYEAPLRELSRYNRPPGGRDWKWELESDYEYSKTIVKNNYGDEFVQSFTDGKVVIQCFDDVCKDIVKGRDMLRDLILFKSLQHSCILNVVDVINLSGRPVYIIYEYAQADLKKVSKSPIHFEMIHVKTLMYNILIAIKYIHSAGFVHGNLKPSNVLINEDYSMKLCGFGRAKRIKQPKNGHIEEEKSDNENINGTLQKKSNVEDGADLITTKPKLVKPKNWIRESRRPPQVFYGAPETIFSDQNQTSAADVWSLGCILSDLIGMIKENTPTFLDRSPLFFDRYIIPLDHHKKQISGLSPDSRELLDQIFSIIGTPNNDDDLGFIHQQHFVEYLKNIPAKKLIDLTEMYPIDIGGNADALDLLKQMLQLNPHKRITVDECLNHLFFSVCRDKSTEMKKHRCVKSD